MPVKKRPQQFETSDGMEFNSQEEAERHQVFIDTRESYQRALKAFGLLLAQRQKTADGHTFELGCLRNYYVIHPNYPGLPYLRTVHFSLAYGQQFGVDGDDDVCLVFRELNPQRTQHEYRVSELYANQRSAKEALLAAQEDRLKNFAEQVEQLRGEINPAQKPGG